ncbi:3D domain-containing protein [Brevibacillus borstelensis]|uniref:3D domain-containing protein n=1 Tax=Brevibacillus borstelensis TaxID=45462 RepID=UPI0030D0EA3F
MTAYTSGPESTGKAPGHPAYGITASGARVREGVTAACPPELPFGTRVLIAGVGERTCLDRGGAIKGRRLDVYIADRSEALRFGRKKALVSVKLP